jgi:hypothetical protein
VTRHSFIYDTGFKIRLSSKFSSSAGNICGGFRINAYRNIFDRQVVKEQDCPFQARITPDTAFCRVENENLGLDRVCASCYGKKQWIQAMTLYGFLDKSDIVWCQRGSCLRKVWGGTRFCTRHLRDAALAWGHEQPQMATLRKELASRTTQQWEVPPPSRCSDFHQVLRRLDQIEKGEMPPESLVCMDLEFNNRSCWAEVHEVSIVTLSSGEVLLDAVLERSIRDENTTRRRSRPENTDLYYYCFDRHAFTPRFKRPPRDKHYYGVQSLATKLQAIIHPETVIITWHNSPTDLTVLRTFMEINGHSMNNVLPPNTSCVPIIPQFSNNLGRLPSGQQFCCRLEVIFPLFFPNHKLCGNNHTAIIDTLQLRLMVLTFLELLKPPHKRHHWWRHPTSISHSSSPILQYFQKSACTTSFKIQQDIITSKTCLSKSSSDEKLETKALLVDDDDVTEDEDWASIGARGLREGLIPLKLCR